MPQPAGEILPGQRIRVVHHLLRRALRDDAAAMDAGRRADVDDVVGGQDRVLVVLDDDHRVAEVAQALQRFKQPGIVALVQADGRLVEDIEDAGQAGADLRGEADALRFAARQRARAARQGEVIEADIVEEAQPVADFLEDADGDLVLLLGQTSSAARRTSRAAARMDSSETSPICRPAIFTASASGFSR